MGSGLLPIPLCDGAGALLLAGLTPLASALALAFAGQAAAQAQNLDKLIHRLGGNRP